MEQTNKTQIPKLKWSQRKDKIFLTIDVLNIKDPKIDIIDNQTVKFSATGDDNKNYAFELELYEKVNKEESKFTLASRNIFLNIKKQEKGAYWPRLTKSADKLNYLAVDWQTYIDEDEEEENYKAPKYGNEQGFGGFPGFAGMEGMGGMPGMPGMGGMPGMDGLEGMDDEDDEAEAQNTDNKQANLDDLDTEANK